MKLITDTDQTPPLYCSSEGVYNEEQCPFFRGYKKENGVDIVQCALNLGQTSPGNWKLENKGD